MLRLYTVTAYSLRADGVHATNSPQKGANVAENEGQNLRLCATLRDENYRNRNRGV